MWYLLPIRLPWASSGHQRQSQTLFPPRRKFASSIQGSFLINVFFFYWIRAFLGSFKLSFFLIIYEVKERKKKNTACYLIFGDGGEKSGDASGGRNGVRKAVLWRDFELFSGTFVPLPSCLGFWWWYSLRNPKPSRLYLFFFMLMI